MKDLGFQYFKDEIRGRLQKRKGEAIGFTARELEIIFIVFNNYEAISAEAYNQLERDSIDEHGCSSCGSVNGFDCYCEDETSL